MPSMLITIDTEADNLWARPRRVQTENAKHLPRFQALCERYGFKPTYLTDYDMARSRPFVEFGLDLLKRGTGEIGMHLHAWSTPPLTPLTSDDLRHQPYLMEYPLPVLEEKVAVLTGLLEETFGVAMRSHRAGRWGFNEVYARALVERGYQVDCSVTPSVSWRRTTGDPAGAGGSDYAGFPHGAYRLDLGDLRRPGNSPLLEVPVTIHRRWDWLGKLLPGAVRRWTVVERAFNRFLPAVWLRPRRGNLEALLELVRLAGRRRWRYLEFMLHSSELMAGGSPTFRTEEEIEALYWDLERLFAAIREGFAGATLGEFHDRFTRESPPRAAEAAAVASVRRSG
ncbi:MAG: deacetylase [Thermoanaerobaculia bacterium]